MTTQRPSRPSIGFVALLFVAMASFLVFVPILGNSPFELHLQNFGHIPLFGCISLGFLSVFRKAWSFDIRVQYLLAFSAAALAGLAVEIIQVPLPRDAGFDDLLRNFAGAACFLGFRFSFEKGVDLFENTKFARRVIRWTPVFVVLVLALPTLRSGFFSLILLEKFPVITDFESAASRSLPDPNQNLIRFEPPPRHWLSNKSEHVLSVSFDRRNEYPGFEISLPIGKWSEHQRLCVEIYSSLDSAVSIIIKVADAHHSGDYRDRYTSSFRVKPGANSIVIPLEEIANAPVSRKLDLSLVRWIEIFSKTI